jgi:hypothetical protein
MVDKRPHTAMLAILLGLAFLPVGWVMLGPLKLGSFDAHLAFDNTYAALVGLFGIAFGNAMICVSAFEAMTQAVGGEATDDQAATLAGLWAGAASIGSIIGNVGGPALILLRTPIFCQHEGRAPCFDGMGTVMSVLLLSFAMCFVWNLRDSPYLSLKAITPASCADNVPPRGIGAESEWAHGPFECFASLPNCAHSLTHAFDEPHQGTRASRTFACRPLRVLLALLARWPTCWPCGYLQRSLCRLWRLDAHGRGGLLPLAVCSPRRRRHLAVAELPMGQRMGYRRTEPAACITPSYPLLPPAAHVPPVFPALCHQGVQCRHTQCRRVRVPTTAGSVA